jgi:two-component system phosphate regulon response regulator PhoB
MANVRGCERVLVIEDNGELAEMIAEHLQAQGLEAAVASDAEEALQRLDEEVLPNIILLDLAMPGLRGEELLDRLRAHPSTRDIPVAIVSGATAEYPAALSQADEFLPKPFEVAELDEVIASLCKRARGRRSDS